MSTEPLKPRAVRPITDNMNAKNNWAASLSSCIAEAALLRISQMPVVEYRTRRPR